MHTKAWSLKPCLIFIMVSQDWALPNPCTIKTSEIEMISHSLINPRVCVLDLSGVCLHMGSMQSAFALRISHADSVYGLLRKCAFLPSLNVYYWTQFWLKLMWLQVFLPHICAYVLFPSFLSAIWVFLGDQTIPHSLFASLLFDSSLFRLGHGYEIVTYLHTQTLSHSSSLMLKDFFGVGIFDLSMYLL